MQFYYPDQPDIPVPAGHRFPASKYRLLRETVERADHKVGSVELLPSPLIEPAELRLIHSTRYIEAILTGTLDAKAVRQLGLPVSDTLKQRSLATVGGSLAAARTALETGCSAQLAGGTHHAHKDFGSGFCVFNDLAFVAHKLIGEGAVERVAILDCDVHQGDGTAALTCDEPNILTVDLFGEKNFPARKVAADVCLPLADGTSDTAYLEVLEIALARVRDFSPGLMLYNAGVDPLETDRLGRLSLSLQGLTSRDRLVFTFARQRAFPIVSVAGGGYSEPISLTVTAYANTLKALCEVFD
ncbi:MAG: histone deacetylase [Alphaproteobacteria bacterium]|nr:histone deacetylase [Alphaproteobacteria bacterium]